MPRTAHREQVLTPGAPARVRRKILLEWVSLVVPLAVSVYFAALVFVSWSPAAEIAAALGTTAALTVVLLGFRRVRPPSTERSKASDDLDDDDDEPLGWDVVTVLFVAGLALVAVVLLALAFVASFAVIITAALVTGATLGETALVIGLTLAVSFVVELAVVIPLARRWGFDLDDAPGRDDLSPAPRSAPSPL